MTLMCVLLNLSNTTAAESVSRLGWIITIKRQKRMKACLAAQLKPGVDSPNDYYGIGWAHLVGYRVAQQSLYGAQLADVPIWFRSAVSRCNKRPTKWSVQIQGQDINGHSVLFISYLIFSKCTVSILANNYNKVYYGIFVLWLHVSLK